MQNERIEFLDGLRVVSAYLVILLHVLVRPFMAMVVSRPLFGIF